MAEPSSAARTASARWRDRYALGLDLLVGVFAAVAALIGHLASSIDQLDPRLSPPSVLSGACTVLAGLSLAVRRIRPITAFLVLAVATSVVSLTNHYVALLPLLLLLSL